MKVQIYKPCLDVKFHEQDNNYVFANVEVTNLVGILERSGVLVQVLSPSDRKFNRLYNPDWRILVNGRLYDKNDSLDERVAREREEISKIFNGQSKQAAVITDWKIVDRNAPHIHLEFDKLLTQSPAVPEYVEYEKLFLFGENFHNNSNRKNKVVYVGNQRGGIRDADIKRFLLTSGVDFDLFGNWDLPESKGKIPARETKELISNYDFGLCLTEELYIQAQHRTPRMWEYFLSGAIAFVDSKYPRDLSVIPEDDFRVVNNGDELKDKMQYLSKRSNILNFLRRKQYYQVQKYFDGRIVGDKILKVLKNGAR